MENRKKMVVLVKKTNIEYRLALIGQLLEESSLFSF